MQHSRVAATSTSIKQCNIEQKDVQSNVLPSQQEQNRDVLRSKSNLSHNSKSKSLNFLFFFNHPQNILSLQDHLPVVKEKS